MCKLDLAISGLALVLTLPSEARLGGARARADGTSFFSPGGLVPAIIPRMRSTLIPTVVIGSALCLTACQSEAPPTVVVVPQVKPPPSEPEAAPTCPQGRHLQDKE